jgi:hypothetical protein
MRGASSATRKTSREHTRAPTSEVPEGSQQFWAVPLPTYMALDKAHNTKE